MYRVGIGYDIHKLIKNKKLILAGIEIPFAKGLLGHSDADVVLHAIIDAIFGALGKGDIGDHFPDSDLKFKGISSIKLLKETLTILRQNKYKIENIDLNILLEEPKLKNFKPKMRKNLASLLGIGVDLINIKAKTNEGLGEIGKKQAIAAQAIILLKR